MTIRSTIRTELGRWRWLAATVREVSPWTAAAVVASAYGDHLATVARRCDRLADKTRLAADLVDAAAMVLLAQAGDQ